MMAKGLEKAAGKRLMNSGDSGERAGPVHYAAGFKPDVILLDWGWLEATGSSSSFVFQKLAIISKVGG